jgi:hypothetical protein
MTLGPGRLLAQPIQAGQDRVKIAAWLLLLETLLAAAALRLDSIDAQQSLPSVADLSGSTTTAFAVVMGPLVILPVLIVLVLAAMAVGIRPRGGRWFTLPAQLAAVSVLLISLRGIPEAIAAAAMVLVGFCAELLLFKPPRDGETDG